MSGGVLRERRGRILVITINRPEQRNAVNLAVSQGLADAVDELDDSPDLSVAVTEPGEALTGAIELAERITANGPLAVATTKEILVKSASWSEEEMWKKQLEHILPVFASNDAKEGAIAFAEKRAPNWTGT